MFGREGAPVKGCFLCLLAIVLPIAEGGQLVGAFVMPHGEPVCVR